MRSSQPPIHDILRADINRFIELLSEDSHLIQHILIGSQDFPNDEKENFHVAFRDNIRKLIEQLKDNFPDYYKTYASRLNFLEQPEQRVLNAYDNIYMRRLNFPERESEPEPEQGAPNAEAMSIESVVEPLQFTPPSAGFAHLTITLGDLKRFNAYLKDRFPAKAATPKQAKDSKQPTPEVQTPNQKLFLAAAKTNGFDEVKKLFNEHKEFNDMRLWDAVELVTEVATKGSKETLNYLLVEKNILKRDLAPYSQPEVELPRTEQPLVFFAAKNPDKKVLASLPIPKFTKAFVKIILAGNAAELRREAARGKQFPGNEPAMIDFFWGLISYKELVLATQNLDFLYILIHELKLSTHDLPLYAAKLGSLPLLQFSIKEIRDAKQELKLETQETNSKKTALYFACEQGNPDMVRTLINAGADYKSRAKDLMQVMITNCRCDECEEPCRHLEILKLFVEKGADPIAEMLAIPFSDPFPNGSPSDFIMKFFINLHPELTNRPYKLPGQDKYETFFIGTVCNGYNEGIEFLITKQAQLAPIIIRDEKTQAHHTISPLKAIIERNASSLPDEIEKRYLVFELLKAGANRYEMHFDNKGNQFSLFDIAKDDQEITELLESNIDRYMKAVIFENYQFIRNILLGLSVLPNDYILKVNGVEKDPLVFLQEKLISLIAYGKTSVTAEASLYRPDFLARLQKMQDDANTMVDVTSPSADAKAPAASASASASDAKRFEHSQRILSPHQIQLFESILINFTNLNRHLFGKLTQSSRKEPKEVIVIEKTNLKHKLLEKDPNEEDQQPHKKQKTDPSLFGGKEKKEEAAAAVPKEDDQNKKGGPSKMDLS